MKGNLRTRGAHMGGGGGGYKSDVGSTEDTPYLAPMGELGVSFVNICEKIDLVITAPHCTCIHMLCFTIWDEK